MKKAAINIPTHIFYQFIDYFNKNYQRVYEYAPAMHDKGVDFDYYEFKHGVCVVACLDKLA